MRREEMPAGMYVRYALPRNRRCDDPIATTFWHRLRDPQTRSMARVCDGRAAPEGWPYETTGNPIHHRRGGERGFCDACLTTNTPLASTALRKMEEEQT